MSTTVSGPASTSEVPDPAMATSPQPDYRRLVLPLVLAAPVVLLIALTEVWPSGSLRPVYLDGGLLAYSGAEPGSGAFAAVVAASVSSLLGMLICRWHRWWGFALAVWPFLLLLVVGTFVWAWLPALVGVAVIVAVDDWRAAIPAWAVSVAVGVLYCLSGVNALILGGPVNIRVRSTAVGAGGSGRVDLALTSTYLGFYVLGPTVAVLVAVAVGMIRRARRERSGATAVLQDALATKSVASERARVARDLHDVVAHHISLVAVRAESAPFVHPGLGEPAREVLAEIADDARRALDELRQVLTVLERSGGDHAERAPQPGAADVATLIEQANAAGQQVTSTGDWGQVPAAAGYVLYRVVQEALSNARRHAPGRPVNVACSGDVDSMTVTVLNPVDDRYRPGPAGRGLIGMRERVSVLGGTLDTGLKDGAFLVSAVLPRIPNGRPE